jgi:hypothetical protein
MSQGQGKNLTTKIRIDICQSIAYYCDQIKIATLVTLGNEYFLGRITHRRFLFSSSLILMA